MATKMKKNLRLIDASNYSFKKATKFLSANEEILVQSEDMNKFNIKNFKVVSKKKPNSQQIKNLIFAFNICVDSIYTIIYPFAGLIPAFPIWWLNITRM